METQTRTSLRLPKAPHVPRVWGPLPPGPLEVITLILFAGASVAACQKRCRKGRELPRDLVQQVSSVKPLAGSGSPLQEWFLLLSEIWLARGGVASGPNNLCDSAFQTVAPDSDLDEARSQELRFLHEGSSQMPRSPSPTPAASACTLAGGGDAGLQSLRACREIRVPGVLAALKERLGQLRRMFYSPYIAVHAAYASSSFQVCRPP